MHQFEIQPANRSSTSPIKPEEKVAAANRDRILLTRIFALLICLIAIVNILPSYLFWHRWSQQIAPPTLPGWVYWQVFVAGLCLTYAVFLVQIADWTALMSVSIMSLILAMGYGLITVSLILGGANSPAARWLALDGPTLDRGTTWCAAMLCTATLISYLGGRESSRWKRSQQLLEKVSPSRAS